MPSAGCQVKRIHVVLYVKVRKWDPRKFFPSTKLNYGCLNDNIASPGNNSILWKTEILYIFKYYYTVRKFLD